MCITQKVICGLPPPPPSLFSPTPPPSLPLLPELQSLVATQQVINQTSAIIKHQQKLLSASSDSVTPATQPLSPPSTKHTTPHSTPHHPHARQKLLFNPTAAGQQQQVNGPSSQDQAVGGATPATPVQNSVAAATEMSPQMMGMESV